MTHRIYGSTKYYMEVARANDLTSFRKLDVGKSLAFYPLEKAGS